MAWFGRFHHSARTRMRKRRITATDKAAKPHGARRYDKRVTRKRGVAQRPGWTEQHAENETRAVQARRGGASYREIGRAFNVSAMTAHRWVQAALAESIQLRDGAAD